MLWCDEKCGVNTKTEFLNWVKLVLTFSQFSTYPCKYTGYCDSRTIPGQNAKKSLSIRKRKDLKFLQYTTSCDPWVRLECLKGNCVVDLNAEDASISSNMVDLLRYGVIDNVRAWVSPTCVCMWRTLKPRIWLTGLYACQSVISNYNVIQSIKSIYSKKNVTI